LRFFGFTSSSSSSSTEGRFKLSVSFAAFTVDSFGLFEVSVPSLVLPSLGSVSLATPVGVLSTDALDDVFVGD